MNAERLIEILRQQIDDVSAPQFFSDETLMYFLTEAEEQACRRAKLLVDSTTAQICEIPLPANTTPLFDLDRRVIFIRRVKLSSNGRILGVERTRDLDAGIRNWEARTGSPMAYLTDYESDKIRFDRTPTADDTALLQVTRLPLKEITDLGQEPEIHRRWHHSLLHWVRYRCYSTEDEQVFDPNKASLALGLFEGEFGTESSAQNEQWDHENLPLDHLDGHYN